MLLLLVVPLAFSPGQRAESPASKSTATTNVVAAANTFLATLSEEERTNTLFDFAGVQRTGWSNLPSGIFQRKGLRLGDLTVVKRAVAAQSATQAVPETREVGPEGDGPRREEARRPRTPGKDPTWLKVRVTEKGTSRKKVTVNLPLALVKAVGDDWPRIHFDCGERRYSRCGVKISEVLAALESGQDLVEIDDEDSLVRIWVE